MLHNVGNITICTQYNKTKTKDFFYLGFILLDTYIEIHVKEISSSKLL